MQENTKKIEMETFKVDIGIDVATGKTGFAAYVNNKLNTYGAITTNPKLSFSGEKITKDYAIIQEQILAFVGRLKTNIEQNRELDNKYLIDVVIVLENSNHGFSSVAQKLSTYIGLYSAAVVGAFNLLMDYEQTTLKMVSPREWQFRAFNGNLEREDGKAESIDRALKIIERDFKKEDRQPIDDNVADAINIGSLARVLRDNLITRQHKNIRAKESTSNMNNILKAEIMLNKIIGVLGAKKLKTITKLQTAKKVNLIAIIEATKKPLIKYATAEQVLRITKNKQILINSKANLETINKFKILGQDGK